MSQSAARLILLRIVPLGIPVPRRIPMLRLPGTQFCAARHQIVPNTRSIAAPFDERTGDFPSFENPSGRHRRLWVLI